MFLLVVGLCVGAGVPLVAGLLSAFTMLAIACAFCCFCLSIWSRNLC